MRINLIGNFIEKIRIFKMRPVYKPLIRTLAPKYAMTGKSLEKNVKVKLGLLEAKVFELFIVIKIYIKFILGW